MTADRRVGPTHPHMLSLRLTETQYRHLVVMAGINEISISEAARLEIERAIDAHGGVLDEQTGEQQMAWRTFLKLHLGLDEAIREANARDDAAADSS